MREPAKFVVYKRDISKKPVKEIVQDSIELMNSSTIPDAGKYTTNRNVQSAMELPQKHRKSVGRITSKER